MKKIVALVCASCLSAALLAGCGQPQTATPEQVQAAKASNAQQDSGHQQEAQGTGHTQTGTTGTK